jgi:hypothetical protein
MRLVLDCNSSGFDAQPVVHCDPQTLLAADVALRCLYRDMPEKELDLLKLAAGIMAESRTGASQIVWRKTWKIILAAVFLMTDRHIGIAGRFRCRLP